MSFVISQNQPNIVILLTIDISTATSLIKKQVMPKLKNQLGKQQQVSLIITLIDHCTSMPSKPKSCTISSPNLAITSLPAQAITCNLLLQAFEEAASEADKACKLGQQASQLLLQKASNFFLDVEQFDFANHLKVAQATALIQQFTLKTAQALANSNITDLESSFQRTGSLPEPRPAARPNSHIT